MVSINAIQNILITHALNIEIIIAINVFPFPFITPENNSVVE